MFYPAALTNPSISILADDLPPGMTVEELFGEGGIEVTILEGSRGQTKLGIDAPMMLKGMYDVHHC